MNSVQAPNNQATDTEYREQMKQIFARFKGQSPDAFILDLRYNPGGYLSCATDLGSYLAPRSRSRESILHNFV